MGGHAHEPRLLGLQLAQRLIGPGQILLAHITDPRGLGEVGLASAQLGDDAGGQEHGDEDGRDDGDELGHGACHGHGREARERALDRRPQEPREDHEAVQRRRQGRVPVRLTRRQKDAGDDHVEDVEAGERVLCAACQEKHRAERHKVQCDLPYVQPQCALLTDAATGLSLPAPALLDQKDQIVQDHDPGHHRHARQHVHAERPGAERQHDQHPGRDEPQSNEPRAARQERLSTICGRIEHGCHFTSPMAGAPDADRRNTKPHGNYTGQMRESQPGGDSRPCAQYNAAPLAHRRRRERESHLRAESND